jgi:hypothetical protein
MLREIAQPDVILNNPALAFPIAAGEKQAETLDGEIASLEGNLHILTSDEHGIARREKILGIIPLDTDTLAERAYRVLVKWYDTYPYTRRNLIARLKRLVGDGKFTFDIGFQDVMVWKSFQGTRWSDLGDITWREMATMGPGRGAKTLKVLIELTSKKDIATIRKLIDDIVPLDIAIDVGLRYRVWASFPGARWSDFTGISWREMATIENEYE